MIATGPSTSQDPPSRVIGWFGDSLFLAAVVLVSCAPYLTGLGLYSDDWAFLSTLQGAGTDAWTGLVAALLPMEMATRPVQALELAALYDLFGLQPAGYHAVNTFILTGTAVVMHRALLRLGFSRLAALVVPLVFGLLPHYSTDRVWMAAFQANASVFLYFLSLLTDLRFVEGKGASRWTWKALGSLALLASILAYEITAALLLFNVLVLAHHARLLSPGRWSRSDAPTLLAIASNVGLLSAGVLYKLSTTVRTDLGGGYRLRALRIVREAVPVHFGDYGVELPVRVAQVLRTQPSAGLLLVAALVGLGVGGYLSHPSGPGREDSLRSVRWPTLVVLGGIVFGLGYAVSLTTWEIGFHPTGPNNRTAIGGAIGVGFVFAGSIGMVSTALRSERARRTTLGVLTGLLCAANTLIVGFVADHWVGAADRQGEVIDRIRASFPVMSPGTVLLLDGLCPYVGPAPVFATGWDTTGMLQLTYGERELRGDVLKSNSRATDEGVRTLLFDDVANVYPYGLDLHVLHLGTGAVVTLESPEAAARYLASGSRAPSACPSYTDGDGAEVF